MNAIAFFRKCIRAQRRNLSTVFLDLLKLIYMSYCQLSGGSKETNGKSKSEIQIQVIACRPAFRIYPTVETFDLIQEDDCHQLWC
jgi:hypothetical protein